MSVTDTPTVSGECRWSLRTDLEPEIDLVPNTYVESYEFLVSIKQLNCITFHAAVTFLVDISCYISDD